jgi:aspartyl-tRNA synthetase
LAIITQQDNIRDVVMFPLMKPIADQDASWEQEKKVK